MPLIHRLLDPLCAVLLHQQVSHQSILVSADRSTSTVFADSVQTLRGPGPNHEYRHVYDARRVMYALR